MSTDVENNTCVIAIDAGTTGVRSRAVFVDDRPTIASYREFAQHFPQPGWVEHDATEIWNAVVATLSEVVADVGRDHVSAIGITNQRETVVAWNRTTGDPYGTAIVWQDRRTAARCRELEDAGHLELVRTRTGLVLDPYFSGTKFEWLLRERDIPVDADLALGTIDSWLIWNLTGGAAHVTDVTNASRTMLYDIIDRRWCDELCDLLGVPVESLPAVLPSSGRFGVTSEECGAPAGIPISGVAGDQQAALFGQACFDPGMAKNTYGTGSFVLLNVGPTCPPPTEGMLTTIAWELADGTVAYALEGAIFVTGAAIQWLRDGLNIIDDAAETGPLAASVPDSGGVYVVPAFAGLGSPWWDPYARGTIVGITRGTTRAHITRAVVESMTYQTRDVVDAMVAASGTPITDLRVDGGASVMDLMLQMQADQLGVTVRRPADQETTALGAAFLAGLAEGVWPDLDAIRDTWKLEATFEPEPDRTLTDLAHTQWLRAVALPRLGDGLIAMTRRRSSDRTPAELHRAPIITDRLIIREATRGDARALEDTMDAAGLGEGERTNDGARRFGGGLAEAPVWSATRAVCEKGSAHIVGGVVLTEVADPPDDVRRIGWWLQAGAERYAAELVVGADERLRAMGADRVVTHVRADDNTALSAVEAAGFRRGHAVQHTTTAGRQLDFWEYVRP